MSRREAMPGWGSRIERVRARFKLSRAKLAKRFGVAPTTVRGWKEDDAGTTPLVILRGLNALRVPDVAGALYWLSTGEGPEPFWLDGPSGSDLPPEPRPRGELVAMPREALDAGREAFKILDGARATGSLRDAPAMRAWGVLERVKPFAESDEEATNRRRRCSPGSGTSPSVAA